MQNHTPVDVVRALVLVQTIPGKKALASLIPDAQRGIQMKNLRGIICQIGIH
jgi:hypothetical protein